MHTLALALLAAAMLLVSAAPASAQADPAPASTDTRGSVWGGGLGLTLGSAGWGPVFDLDYRTGPHVLRGRISGHLNVFPMATEYRELVQVMEVAAMYGRDQRVGEARQYRRSFAAGLAMIEVVRDSEEEPTSTVGLALEAQLVRAASGARRGLAAIGNLNPERPFVGLVLSVQVGRVP
jgi:hypothetical protein